MKTTIKVILFTVASLCGFFGMEAAHEARIANHSVYCIPTNP